MARDIAPLTDSLEAATPGEQAAIYPLLANWNTSIETALDRGGGSRYRTVVREYLPEVIDRVDTAAMTTHPEWAFLQDCVDGYPPGTGEHHCSPILANVVARCVIRTRIREGAAAIPAWTLEYLAAITVEDDTEWAWESAHAFGWGIGHPSVAVGDRTVARAEADDESWAMGVLKHVTFADATAGADLLARLLRSPDIVEDLVYLRGMEVALNQPFPDFPQYWGPAAELEYDGGIPDDATERILEVLGETVHPERLRQFADSFAFDLARAAEEYGSEESRERDPSAS